MDPCIKQAPVLSKRFWIIPCLQQVGVGLYQKNNQFLIHFWMKMKSFRDYLGLSNSCSYDVDDVIGRADRFGFQNFCSPGLDDGPDIKLLILVGLGRSFFVCCLAHRGSTVGFLLLQCSSGVVQHPGDFRVSLATRSWRVLIFASS